MSVIFKQENHKYISADPSENIEWISVTSFVGRFKEKFDPITQSIKSSKNKRSKWYGMSPELIQEIWSRKTERAVQFRNNLEGLLVRDRVDLPNYVGLQFNFVDLFPRSKHLFAVLGFYERLFDGN